MSQISKSDIPFQKPTSYSVWRYQHYNVIKPDRRIYVYSIIGWVNLDNPMLQPISNILMDSRIMPEKFGMIPIIGSVTLLDLKIAIFSTYGIK